MILVLTIAIFQGEYDERQPDETETDQAFGGEWLVVEEDAEQELDGWSDILKQTEG